MFCLFVLLLFVFCFLFAFFVVLCCAVFICVLLVGGSVLNDILYCLSVLYVLCVFVLLLLVWKICSFIV